MKKNTKRLQLPPIPSAANYANSEKIELRLARLRQAIIHSRPTRSRPNTHEKFETLLEFFIDSERRQEDVKKIYPKGWEHLQTCERCKSLHAAVTSAPDSFENSSIRPTLPFLAPMPPNALWSKQIRARVGGAPFQCMFIIQPAHLTRTLAVSSSLVLRGDAPPAQKSLLLSDTITFDQQTIDIEAWLYHAQPQTTADLEISAISAEPLPEALRVSLIWNDQRYSSLLQHGKCIFNALPLADLENLRDLRVEFAAESSVP